MMYYDNYGTQEFYRSLVTIVTIVSEILGHCNNVG